MIPYFFMEVECIGNTQIIHMEETGITQRTIGLVSFYRTYLRFTTLLYVQTKGAQAARSHFLLWTAEKKERVSRVESVHPHPHHHPHLTQSRTLFAARAACAE